MERLTYKDPDGNWTIRALPGAAKNAFDKLAEYEDAEESGKLIKLPCKIGDSVFQLVWNSGEEWIVVEKPFMLGDLSFRTLQLGSGIFLARSEAEAALAGRKE